MKSILSLLFAVSLTAQADSVLLPLQTLRDQATTAHCWAYAMSHALESRALTRDSEKVLINIEKDVKYWVDYERMQYIYNSKSNFYLGDYEGAWQIEYWESLLKHGRHFYQNAKVDPVVLYKELVDFFQGLPFMDEARHPKGPRQFTPEVAAQELRDGFASDAEANRFIVDYLASWHGDPTLTTQWNGAEVPVDQSAKLILGSDFDKHNATEAMVLVKPVTDGNFGWVRYLENRYWGYRYDRKQVLELVKMSLKAGWPVTFDNGPHAMTIIAHSDKDGADHYGVADSVPGKITWYPAKTMLANLNLVTFFAGGIEGQLPERSFISTLKLAPGIDIDRLDNVETPPRGR